MNKKHFVIDGDRFGRWTVVQNLGSILDNKVYKTAVLVRCDCGNQRNHFISVLKKGLSKSCGCLRKEKAAEAIKNRTHKHNLSKHPLFQVWRGMKARCYNMKNKWYKDYGERGIYVCAEWVNNFKEFYDWAVNNGWELGLINDRKDNDREYSPSNCRFVTDAVSVRNTRRNHNIEFNNEKKCVTDWAISLNISVAALNKRIKKWGIEKALTTSKQQ